MLTGQAYPPIRAKGLEARRAMPNENYEMLKDAIARNSGAVLALPSAGLVRHHKTRFLGEEENGFWIESTPQERPLLDTLMLEDAPVGVAFKAGNASII